MTKSMNREKQPQAVSKWFNESKGFGFIESPEYVYFAGRYVTFPKPKEITQEAPPQPDTTQLKF